GRRRPSPVASQWACDAMRARRAAVAIISGEGCGVVRVTTVAHARRAGGQSALVVTLPRVPSSARDGFTLAPPCPLAPPLRGDDLVAGRATQVAQRVGGTRAAPVRDRPDVIRLPADAVGDGVAAAPGTDAVIPQEDGRPARGLAGPAHGRG